MTEPTTDQAGRWARREQLGVLLSRMQRGVLTSEERRLLHAAVETELGDAERAHHRADRYRAAWRSARRRAIHSVWRRTHDRLWHEFGQERTRAEQAERQRDAALRVVSAWCYEANTYGGIDAGDLAWRLEQAGHQLPDMEEGKR